MSGKFGFSWSWKRAIGLSAAKSRISREIGVPLTRSGRERKVGAWLLGDTPHAHAAHAGHARRHGFHVAWGLILLLAALFVYSNLTADRTAVERSNAEPATNTSASSAEIPRN